jgi:NADPH-dependent F420 reductase
MSKNKYAILGGTGALGFGLALRLAKAGHTVIIGSRSQANAEAAVQKARELLSKHGIQKAELVAAENCAAAAAADIVAVTVPYAQQHQLLASVADHLKGKILIDATVPLVPPKVSTVQLPEGGSAVLAAQAFLGENVKVVSAFQNVAADKLQSLEPLECDVLVTGNDRASCEEVVNLINQIGSRAYYAGPLANSVAAEALTSLLITINRQFKCQAGIRITGVK